MKKFIYIALIVYIWGDILEFFVSKVAGKEKSLPTIFEWFYVLINNIPKIVFNTILIAFTIFVIILSIAQPRGNFNWVRGEFFMKNYLLFTSLLFSTVFFHSMKTYIEKTYFLNEETEIYHKYFPRITFIGFKETMKLFFGIAIGSLIICGGITLVTVVYLFIISNYPEWIFWKGGMHLESGKISWIVFYWLTVIFLYAIRLLFIVFCLILGLMLFITGATITSQFAKGKAQAFFCGIIMSSIVNSIILAMIIIRLPKVLDAGHKVFGILMIILLIIVPITCSLTNNFRKKEEIINLKRMKKIPYYGIEFIDRKIESIHKQSAIARSLEKKGITIEMVADVEKIVAPINKASVKWISAVTQLSEMEVRIILEKILYYIVIENNAYSLEFYNRKINSKFKSV